MKYEINLIRQIRQKQKSDQTSRSMITIFACMAFATLFLTSAWSVRNVLQMRLSIDRERRELGRIEAEYRKYKTTKMIVDKADIELLDRLQTGRIFWTKKLEAMASHLPNRPPNPYWITRFSYDKSSLSVKGYGFISRQQEQLMTIDDYLNALRADSSFSDVFGACFLKSTARDDEGFRERVSFEYSAERARGRRR